MQALKQVINFYLNSSIHVALAASALVWVTGLEFNLDWDFNLFGFVFFATISGYNFVKFFGVAKFHHRSLARWLRVIQMFSLLAFLAMCFFVISLKFEALILTGILGVITFFYAIPVMVPKHYFFDDHKNLRQIGGLKVYLIALIWTVVTVFLPLVNEEVPIGFDAMITGFQRFCFVLVLMLPFEIRDLNYDSIKLATIPQKIGIKNTKIIGVLLLMLFVLLNYFKDTLSIKVIISTVSISVLTGVFLLVSKKDQSKYHSAFWVESLPIVWWLIFILLG
ncbi:hypothetical protein HNV08_13095 [Winogradskyella eckloniae]|uniref:hypothetical protein n=1 Tax=Winogradskyella eckloniae TaxID=1089306 RepID=UPI001563E5A0|nr:hypothetical protein [Winogradskyella eckloniae]NRD20986.1 hypothetical protein [Winogradskyella eckloniae]